MKKSIVIIRAVFIVVFSLLLTPNFTEAKAFEGNIPVQLKFIGNMNNQPLFQLTFSGTPSENDFVLSIKDDEGYVLYRENIKESNFSKKFLLNTDEIDDKTLLFEINNKKTNQTVVYQVNRHSRQIEEMLISKL